MMALSIPTKKCLVFKYYYLERDGETKRRFTYHVHATLLSSLVLFHAGTMSYSYLSRNQHYICHRGLRSLHKLELLFILWWQTVHAKFVRYTLGQMI